MSDNNLALLSSGAADWDADLDANFGIIERGYHLSQFAGLAINTGEVLQLNSAGFFSQFNPNTPTNIPAAMAFTAAASGDAMTALAWGIVRSLAINSDGLPGKPLWVSAATPGLIVGSSAVQNIPIGLGLPAGGVLFAPAYGAAGGGGGGASALSGLTDVNTTGVSSGKVLAWSDAASKWEPSAIGASYAPTFFVSSNQINAVVGSLHTFTASVGFLHGWNRRVRLNSNSAGFAELKLYSDAAMSNLQYSTISGGISGVNSFNDRAGFPIDTNSGTLYGTVECLSGDVSSATVNVNIAWEF